MAGLSRRDVLGGALAGAGALALAQFIQACGDDDAGPGAASSGGSSAGELTDVGLQLSWTNSVQFGGSYLAADRGYYAREGLDVTLSPGGPNVAGDAQTVSGAVLMNISAGDGVARSNVEGAGLTIVGMQYQKSPATLLSLEEKAIADPTDLPGTRVAVAGTDTPALDAFLTINGIEREDVSFIPSQYDPAVLTAGQADAIFCFYNDLPVALKVQGIPYTTMLLADFGYNPASQVYTVLRSSLEGDAREQVMHLLRGEILGWQDYRTDYDAAAQLAVDRYPDAGLDLETQRQQAVVQLDIMYSDVTDTNGFGWFTDDSIEDNLKLFADLGISGATRDLWNRSLLEEIYAAGPRIS